MSVNLPRVTQQGSRRVMDFSVSDCGMPLRDLCSILISLMVMGTTGLILPAQQ